jgi:D-serine dehydratase
MGWNALTDLMLPVVVLKENALSHNIELMARFCREKHVDFAPHGKTSMSPQLIKRQLEAGAWGITAANVPQARFLRAAGVSRILIANQVIDGVGLRWLAKELASPSDLEILCLVDSRAGVRLMDDVLVASSFTGRLAVLVELGFPGGRAGCRTRAEAKAVATEVLASRNLRLVGVETYEGVADESTAGDSVATVDQILGDLRQLAIELDTEGAFTSLSEVIVSAGGSVYFDRVVEQLAGLELSRPVRTVLRSGCYIAHDNANYGGLGPMGTRLLHWEPFNTAFEVWSRVLSRPEPELAVLGFGKRDVSFDWAFPHPFAVRRPPAPSDPAVAIEIFRLNDHHAYLRVDPDSGLAPGDLVGCTLSHPCTVFDKWRLIPVVNEDHQIVDVVQTYF